ncbi:MAG: hypothetical protein ACXWQO_16955 [Bdellovibrionota bacterium]
MRVIGSIFVFLLLSLQALAAPGDAYLFQLKTQNTPRSSVTPSFWDLVSGRAKLDADLTVKVTDAATGQPLAGTAVMVGTKNGDPFAENILRTDDQGNAIFTNEALRNGNHFPITAGKAGYTLLTLFQNANNVVEIALQPIPAEKDFSFLQGKVTGFPPGFGSGSLELGLFLPATRPEGLLNFDLSLFVSPYKVKVDIYGQRDVPGNVVMPDQHKWWGLIPINISKPDYIMPLPRGLETHMAAMVGSVPISPAVSAIKDKDYISVLNMATFNHVGWTNRRMTVKGDESFNLNASHEVTPGAITSKVSNVPDNLDVISISLVDPEGDGGDFVAMDLKALKAEEVKNGTAQFKLGMIKNRLQGAGYYIFTGIFDRKQLGGFQFLNQPVATTPDYRWIVGSTKPVGSSTRTADTRFSSFLKQMKPTSVGGGNREYHFTSPNSSKLSPDLMIVNIVSEKQNSVTHGKTRSILWSSLVPGAVTDLSLPDLGRPVLPNPDTSNGERFFWEVIAMKLRQRAKPETAIDLQSALRNVEHVSSFTKAF